MSAEGDGCLALSAVITLIIFASVIVFSAGEYYATAREHEAAVKANVGRWTTNAKTGDTTFVYGVSP